MSPYVKKSSSTGSQEANKILLIDSLNQQLANKYIKTNGYLLCLINKISDPQATPDLPPLIWSVAAVSSRDWPAGGSGGSMVGPLSSVI